MKNFAWKIVIERTTLLSILFLLICACGGNDKPVPGSPCEADVECPTGYFCHNQQCTSPTNINCTTTGCPPGYLCLSNGSCLAGAECESNSDCCAASTPEQPVNCEKQCVNSKCVGSECNDTDPSKKCFVGCHEGLQSCESGVLQPCNAPPVLADEVCGDNIDNECDGATDDGCPVCTPGQVQACSTACGDGSQTCGNDSQWLQCDAPTDCFCEPVGSSKTEACGNCGFQEFQCSADGVWVAADVCSGEGECVAGSQESLDCGNCGQQSRVCSQECTWTDWSACLGGACVAGEVEERACGNCGSESRTCDDACQWSPWSQCSEGAGCFEGEVQAQSCGMCGEKTSVCNDQCQWGPFGVCQNEGSCTPGEVDTQPCEKCGHITRVCGDNCQWGAFSVCEGWGECEIGEQETDNSCGPDSEAGICAFGTRIRNCSATCQWNPWSTCAGAIFPAVEICGDGTDQDCDGVDPTNPDPFEINNTCATAAYLGEDPAPSQAECIKTNESDWLGYCSYDGTEENKTWKSCFDDDDCAAVRGSFDNPGDSVDYYYFKGNDSAAPNENIVVKLKNQPIGVDADIFLYKSLADCQNGIAIAQSITIGSGDEEFTWGEGFLVNDEGNYYIRVQNYEGTDCWDDYELTVDGLR